jgi:DNA-binding Lrp family transcriptional regulator
MDKLDEKDERILQMVEKNPHPDVRMIAKELGVSMATARRRFSNLTHNKYIYFGAFKNPDKLDLPVLVLIGLKIDLSRLDSATKQILAQPEIIFAWMTTGRFDAFLMARFASNDDLSLFVRNVLTKIEGLKDIETFLCLDNIKTNVLFYTGSH